MPSFATTTVFHDHVNALDIQLHVSYNFIVGEPSSVVHTIKNGIPHGVDVVLQTDLAVSLSGNLNRAVHNDRLIQNSAIAQHVLDYFHAVGDGLGVRVSSNVYFEEDGTAKLTFSPTRPFLERQSPYIRLNAIDLIYVCTTAPLSLPHPVNSPGLNALYDAFARVDTQLYAIDHLSMGLRNALLPITSALDCLLEKLVLHLMRHYPLIFGPWRERFDGEFAVIPKLTLAIENILRRSPHAAFRKKTRQIVKALNISETHANADLKRSLQEALSNTFNEDLVVRKGLSVISDAYILGHADILSRALERIYKALPESRRRRDFCALLPNKSSGMALHEFALSGCLEPRADPDLGKTDIWFDEDADTVIESQDNDDDVSIQDDLSLIDDIDINIWVDDELGSHSPLESSDDVWDSLQSTTLDFIQDPMLCWADLFAPLPTGLNAAYSGICWRAQNHVILDPDPVICDDDEWPEDLTHPSDAESDPGLPWPWLAVRQLVEATDDHERDRGQNAWSLPRLSVSGLSASRHQYLQTETQGFDAHVLQSRGETTYQFHMLLDDDLELQEFSHSGTCLGLIHA